MSWFFLYYTVFIMYFYRSAVNKSCSNIMLNRKAANFWNLEHCEVSNF